MKNISELVYFFSLMMFTWCLVFVCNDVSNYFVFRAMKIQNIDPLINKQKCSSHILSSVRAIRILELLNTLYLHSFLVDTKEQISILYFEL